VYLATHNYIPLILKDESPLNNFDSEINEQPKGQAGEKQCDEDTPPAEVFQHTGADIAAVICRSVRYKL
jgi:hypothetical protein